MLRLVTFAAFALALAACGPGIDRQGTLDRLKEAMDEDVSDQALRDEHNQLVVDVSRHGLLEGMTRAQVEEAIGPGRPCGPDPLCARQGFAATDWMFDVGRSGGYGTGPTLIVGFGRFGQVDGTYYLTR